MSNQLDLPKGFLGRCPSCFLNFARIFCHMTCAKNQADYIKITSSEPSKEKPGQKMVDSITYAITEEFAQGMFDSCKDVLMPSSTSKALSLLCGQYGDQCTPHLWL